MDTKWSGGKAAISLLALFLGMNLLFASGLLFLYGMRLRGAVAVRDAFASDYQDTRAFREAMEERLQAILKYAAQGDQEEFDRMKDQRNLIYFVKQGSYVYLNDDTLRRGVGRDLSLEGYDFVIYMMGGEVSIIKDGTALDVYGDGYYREGDWKVPGYENYPVSPENKNTVVYLAAAAQPKYYTGYNPLFGIQQGMERDRRTILILSAVPAAGLALLIWSFLWRKERRRPEQAAARATGKVCLELKIVILAGLAFLVYKTARMAYNIIRYGWQFHNCLWPLAAFWVAWCCVNDLRHNGLATFQNSFVHWLVRQYICAELKLPIQKRLCRRAWTSALLLFVAVGFPTVGSVIIAFSEMRYGHVGGRFLLLSLSLAGAAVIAYQVLCLRRNLANARDLGILTDQIKAMQDGSVSALPDLPENADLRAAAEQLSGIRQGMEQSLERALEERTKSERMKVELVANVSHDLKTPLTSILSYAELLSREEGLPDHVMDYIHILNDKAERLRIMVQEVFEVSKAASGNLSVRMAPLDLGKLLAQTLADMGEAVERSGLRFKVDLPEHPVIIRADGDRLYRVVQNLVQNALQYALDGSRVYVALRTEGASAIASVKNISREELPPDVDFTARFTRGDASRTDGGSGLGLAIASSFTAACGGAFSVSTDADLFTAQMVFPLSTETVVL